MADVFLAVVQGPAGFNKLVVIKKARREIAHEPEFLAMFLDEARLAARLNHPNVVQTLEVGRDGDRYFIAMEYLDGQPLNRVRARAGSDFTVPMQVRVLADVLAGLHHAHELCDFDGTPLGVVHRDATPQNMFVTYDGVVKVVDFGIAKAVDSSSETRAGVLKGKITYMAPEQARCERADRRADIFAVGVMLWEAIAGRRMWKGIPEIAVVHELLSGRIPSIREAVPDVPDALAAICERAMAPNKEDRYANAPEMQNALEAHLLSCGAHVSSRDVGRFVAERFAEDRGKVKALIESQLRDVRWSGSYPKVTFTDLPRIDPGPLSATPTHLEGGGAQRISVTSKTEISPASGSFTGASIATGREEAPKFKAGKPAVLFAVAAVTAVAMLVVGLRFFGPRTTQVSAATPALETAAVAATPNEASSAPAQDEAVKLTVHVSPPTAKVFVDDKLVSTGTFEGKVARSDKPVRVRVEEPHYVAKEESVKPSGDSMLSFSLEREAEAADPHAHAAAPHAAVHGRPAPPTQAAPASPPPAAPAAPTPTAVQRPKRSIDSESPYAQ